MFYKLLRKGYIIESPTPDIDTEKIMGKFRHEFSFLPESGQKRSVYVLLAWKRGIVRMQFLEGELEKVEETIADASGEWRGHRRSWRRS